MKEFQVEFADTIGDRFANEYGFGTNPPAHFKSDSETKLRTFLAMIMEPGIEIREIKEV